MQGPTESLRCGFPMLIPAGGGAPIPVTTLAALLADLGRAPAADGAGVGADDDHDDDARSTCSSEASAATPYDDDSEGDADADGTSAGVRALVGRA